MTVIFLVAMLVFTGRVDQMWESVELSFFSELVPGLTPGCGDAVAAEQVRASCVLTPQGVQMVAWASCARGGR